MASVTGIGGIFFKCKDSAATREWYREHLGIQSEDWGYAFLWRTSYGDASKGYTVWSPFAQDSNYFDPSDSSFMINLRVEGMTELIAKLRSAGVQVVGDIVEEANGKFAWIVDLDGRKVELWEPEDPDKDPYLPK